MLIPLKLKYTTAKRSRYQSTHNDSYKKQKKYSGGRTTVAYNPEDHVLLVKAGGGKLMLHYEDAHRALGR